MGLFGKKENKIIEKNLINDNKEKETIANFAIDFLTKNSIINDLVGIQCEFGYIYYIDNHGYEALFKIKKNDSVYYFAFQGMGLLYLNSMDENAYQAHVYSFNEMHQK